MTKMRVNWRTTTQLISSFNRNSHVFFLMFLSFQLSVFHLCLALVAGREQSVAQGKQATNRQNVLICDTKKSQGTRRPVVEVCTYIRTQFLFFMKAPRCSALWSVHWELHARCSPQINQNRIISAAWLHPAQISGPTGQSTSTIPFQDFFLHH